MFCVRINCVYVVCTVSCVCVYVHLYLVCMCNNYKYVYSLQGLAQGDTDGA